MVLKYSSLKQKDLDYMIFILRNGVVTAKQIQLKFQEPNLDRVYRRLRKLIDRGYIKNERLAHKVGVYIGTKEARDATRAAVTVPTKLSLYTIQHELLIADLILYHEFISLKKGWEFSYKSEREYRFEAIGDGDQGEQLKKYNETRERIPDATFFITNGGQTLKIWVELEINKKDQRRYDEKFRGIFDPMLSAGDFSQVWYFTDAQKIRNGVERAKDQLINKDKIKIYDIPSEILSDDWERVLPNGANDGESEGEGGI